MLKKDKDIFIKEWTENLKANQSFILTDYKGLKVEEFDNLRSDLRKLNSEYRVIKNRLFLRVCKELKMDELFLYLKGPTAIVMEKGDPVLVSKTLVDFTKEHENLKIKAGLLDGRFITSGQIKQLASLPPKNILLTSLAMGVMYPIQSFHNVLTGIIAGLVNVLEAARKKKEEESK